MRQYSSTQLDVFRNPQHEMLLAPPAAMACLWSRTSMLKEIWDVVQEVGAWPGMQIVPDGSGLYLGLALSGVMLGHVRWNGRIDLTFAPEIRDRLVAEEMASLDPDQPGARRVMLVIRTIADVDRAVWLLRLAYLNLDSNANSGASSDIARTRGRRFSTSGDL
jgi:hypothetical protein